MFCMRVPRILLTTPWLLKALSIVTMTCRARSANEYPIQYRARGILASASYSFKCVVSFAAAWRTSIQISVCASRPFT